MLDIEIFLDLEIFKGCYFDFVRECLGENLSVT